MGGGLEHAVELFYYFGQVYNVLALVFAGSDESLAEISLLVEAEDADCAAKGS